MGELILIKIVAKCFSRFLYIDSIQYSLVLKMAIESIPRMTNETCKCKRILNNEEHNSP